MLKSGASLDAVNAEGQTPVELALDRRNNWIVNQLQEEQFQRGVGKPGFIKKITSDPVSIVTGNSGFPVILLYTKEEKTI